MRTVEVSCPYEGCGYSPFPMEAEFYDRAQKTKEGFHCPAGHEIVFRGKPWREERKELKAQIKMWKDENIWLRDERITIARTCPWPNCDFIASSGSPWDRRPLWNHMRAAHDMPALYQILAEVEAMEATVV